ncbi:MAG TPA: hypothetical protein VF676_03175 [Flavobacterium sp.]|jgi:hypothetical protein
MISYKLSNHEIEELELMIPVIEKMYRIQFERNDLSPISNTDEFCELIIAKMNLRNVESCTSQQVFNKLRNSFVKHDFIKKDDLRINTELKLIFPQRNRKAYIKKVEDDLNIKLRILKAPDFILFSLAIITIISFVLLFINWKAGILGLGFSILGYKLCNEFGNELDVLTVKELVETLTRENYLNLRSEQNTINKKELKNILIEWLAENSGIEGEKLKAATFI